MKATGKQWGEKNGVERLQTVLMTVSKVVLVLLLLYMFILSLGLMGGAFKVLGGKTSGKTFRQSELFDNPVAGLALGIPDLFCMLFQDFLLFVHSFPKHCLQYGFLISPQRTT